MGFIDALVQQLRATKGDLHAQAAAAAEFLVSAQPEAKRDQLRAGLDAAAVLRWFDVPLLAKVLEISPEEARGWHEALIALPFVETYRVHDSEIHNLHESVRLGWRKQFAQGRPEHFRILSLRAAACFADDQATSARIEWIYHLLCGDPDQGATELEKLDREWTSRAHPEDFYALAAALKELEDAWLLRARARVWALLVIAWTRASRAENAQLANVAQDILQQARFLADQQAEADAQCLLGDVSQAQGKLGEARAAFEESLMISRRLVEQDPGNSGWQRELAVACGRVGGVLQAQGMLGEAQAAFGEDLRIFRRLAEQDPSNAGWQSDLATAYSRVGDVLQAQGKLAEAHTAFGEALTISRRLAEQDPSNAGWQSDLATAYSRVGDVLQVQGKLGEAQAAFEEALTICRKLAEQDPSNAGWQRELAVAYNRLGGVLQAQGMLGEAQAAFGGYLTISRRLAEQDPSNAGWQHDLAAACFRMARLECELGGPARSLPLYEEASRIYGALATTAPDFAQWAEEKTVVDAELERCRSRV